MRKITCLAFGALTSLSFLYSAAFEETSASASARPLQKFFDEKLHEIIERRLDTPDLSGSEFFPTAYKNRNIDISTIHSQAHLWPEQYRKAMFKYGLLNDYIDKYSGFLAIIQGKEDIFKKKLFFNIMFHKSIKIDPEIAESRFKMSCALYLAFQEGLHQNEQLLSIGANYLKHKIREEAISAQEREAKVFDASLKSRERARGDLLQDLAWTITRRACEIMQSTVCHFIKEDSEFQALVAQKEQFEKDYSENLSEFLTDNEFMAEVGAPYKQCLERFEKYVQATRKFFAMYTPIISNFDPAEFQTLELIHLGIEDIRTVPRNLREVVDSETH